MTMHPKNNDKAVRENTVDITFQKNTVDAVIKAFGPTKGARRFLVADEVGLGKTIVAQKVIQRMAESKPGPLKVIYMCSNLAIARQNQDKLLGFLSADERVKAKAKVDRLTLWMTENKPTSREVHFYPVTPATSVPFRGKRGNTGTVRERAFLSRLLLLMSSTRPRWKGSKFNWLPGNIKNTSLRSLRSKWKGQVPSSWFNLSGRNAFKGRAKTFWRVAEELVTSVLNKRFIAPGNYKQLSHFSRCICDVYASALSKRAHPKQLFLDKNQQKRHKPSSHDIAILRNALALHAVRQIKPDLIVFDEFQRFEDILHNAGNDYSNSLMGALRGDRDAYPPNQHPALLLLSATPYKMYTEAKDGIDTEGHYHDFFRLVSFLYGGPGVPAARKNAAHLKELFSERRQCLLGKQPGGVENKTKIEALLRQVMCRTERHVDPTKESKTITSIQGDVTELDARVFAHFSASVEKHNQSGLTAYWDSIPLPMQTMGKGYVATRDVKPAFIPPVDQRLTKRQRNALRPLSRIGHPKLRALTKPTSQDSQEAQAIADPVKLMTPWVAPSFSWWPLQGPWLEETSRPEKLLVFSRFKAVPQAVSGILSYQVEAEIAKKHKMRNYERISNYQPLRYRDTGIYESLFQPSLMLAFEGDPTRFLDGSNCSASTIRQKIKLHLRRIIRKQCKLRIDKKCNFLKKNSTYISNPNEPPDANIRTQMLSYFLDHQYYFFGPLKELTFRNWKSWYPHSPSKQTRNEIHRRCRWMDDHVTEINEYTITNEQLNRFTSLALGSPGNILLRSILRSAFGRLSIENLLGKTFDNTFKKIKDLSIKEFHDFFNSYLMCNTALTKRKKQNAWQRVTELCINGNLESVLDEHFWVYLKINSLDSVDPAQKIDSLITHIKDLCSLHNGWTKLEQVTSKRRSAHENNSELSKTNHTTDKLAVKRRRPKPINLRTHAARAFLEAKSDTNQTIKGKRKQKRQPKKLGSTLERLGKRFNSPFWPHVLVTTSVGQEGLDFHVWCNSLIHWDVRTNPIDMEQREGRIQRFAGLGVRKAIAAKCEATLKKTFTPGESPWQQLEKLACKKDEARASRETTGDDSMHPWWTFNGSHPQTYHFQIPFAQQNLRFERVRNLQKLYRLALGQVNQEGLVKAIGSNEEMTSERIKELTISLKPLD